VLHGLYLAMKRRKYSSDSQGSGCDEKSSPAELDPPHRAPWSMQRSRRSFTGNGQ
jgi:hypothetical protein